MIIAGMLLQADALAILALSNGKIAIPTASAALLGLGTPHSSTRPSSRRCPTRTPRSRGRRWSASTASRERAVVGAIA